MQNICIYLRKSRADEELEKSLGQGETLSKHRKALLKFSKINNLNITEIKEEIVSGENLLFRPKMLELLQEVEEKKYTGVLVMDIQRLGRGDMQDQGMILKAFKQSNTKIITPQKTYDLTNDFDEEYTEFEAFMSRKELKMINRRMQGGRVRSVEDGNYIATNPPIGYDIHHINKFRTLKVNEEEAEIIKLIFSLYTNNSGAQNIATHLNSLGYKTKLGNKFSSSSILTILRNPVYIGKVTWKKKDIRKSLDPNKVKDTRTRDKSEWIIADGKHKPIIDNIIFEDANTILENKYHIPYQLTNKPVNPFAGVLKCGICGKSLVARKLRGIQRVMCTYKCGNKSSRYDIVEKLILESLNNYITSYILSLANNEKNIINPKVEIYQKQLKTLSSEVTALTEQKLKLFDLLERGIYDDTTFLDRSSNIQTRTETIIEETIKIKEIIQNEKELTSDDQNIEEFKSLLISLYNTDDVLYKNIIIKRLVHKIEYTKAESTDNTIVINTQPRKLL